MTKNNKHSKAAMQLSMTYENQSFEKHKKNLHIAFLSNSFPKKEVSTDLTVNGKNVKFSWIPTSEVLRIKLQSGFFDINPLTGKVIGNVSSYNQDEKFNKQLINTAIEWLARKIKDTTDSKNKWFN